MEDNRATEISHELVDGSDSTDSQSNSFSQWFEQGENGDFSTEEHAWDEQPVVLV